MAAAATAGGEGKIFLTCFWNGPTTSASGHLTVHALKLILSESCPEISITIPRVVSAASVTSCLFTSPTYGPTKTINGDRFIQVTESSYEQLHLAIRHLCNLRIYACVCESSFCDDEIRMDGAGHVLQVQSDWPSVSEVPLVLPVDRQKDQNYVLLVESKEELKLSAQVLPHETAKQDFILSMAMMKQLHEARMAIGSQPSAPSTTYYKQILSSQQEFECIQRRASGAHSSTTQEELMQAVMSQVASLMRRA